MYIASSWIDLLDEIEDLREQIREKEKKLKVLRDNFYDLEFLLSDDEASVTDSSYDSGEETIESYTASSSSDIDERCNGYYYNK